MASVTTLGVDTVALKESVTNKNISSSTTSSFDKTLNTVGYLTNTMGPAVVESVYASKGSNAASIVSAAVNATPMALTTSSSTSALSSSTGSYYGSLSTSGSENYLTGGTSLYSTDSSSSSTTTDVQGLISESYANQTYLLAVQTELGQIQNQTNAMSQVISAKNRTASKIIQNIPVG